MRWWLLIFALCAPVAVAQAADRNKAHPHQGVLKPYPQPPAPTKLTPSEVQDLARGEAVYKTSEGETGGRGIAVFQVKAPRDVVWATINSFHMYPTWIDEVTACEVYGKDGNQIFVRFVLKSMGVEIEYFIDHDYRRADTWGTWTLDYAKESDLSDSVGSWLVREVSPGVSQVEYSVDLKVSGWVPSFIRKIIVDSGLEDATEWVKVQSEKKAGQ